ncbi:Serine/threonine-protein kinase ATR-like protein [Drosera capensis]
MATLSSLVHELRDRIAASSSTPSNKSDDIALESRFRAVLPNLLHTCVVPSPTAKEREVVAVLKLLTHTAKNFPGVFYHGRASGILPVVGRIVSFFAEPRFRARHGVIFDTVGALVALLRTGDQDAFRMLFVDAMVAVEDLLHVASVSFDKSSTSESPKVSLRCFSNSFAGLSGDETHLSDIPECNKPTEGTGVSIDLTGDCRWQPFATWIIRLVVKCFTEGTLYVEGLIHPSFIWAACSLLCYGDTDLQMACFDFVHVAGTVMNYDIIPSEKLLLSMCTILNEDDDRNPAVRSQSYDSCMGTCLHAVHSSCPIHIVKSTATVIVAVFYKSILRSESSELKDALCSAYIRIARTCPPNVWRPESLIRMICSPGVSFFLQECLEVAFSVLGADRVGGAIGNDTVDQLVVKSQALECHGVGDKRPAQELKNSKSKRQKADQGTMIHESDYLTSQITAESIEKYAYSVRSFLVPLVDLLVPHGDKSNLIGLEVAVTALSILCLVFSKFPKTNMSLNVFKKMQLWIPWICEQANQSSSIRFDLSVYLKALHSMLMLSGSSSEVKVFFDDSENAELTHSVLKLPWTHSLEVVEVTPPWRTKCLAIQVLSELSFATGSQVNILDLGLEDEMEEVRAEGTISMPLIILSSGFHIFPDIFKRLWLLYNTNHGLLKSIVPHILGYLSCLYGSCYASDNSTRSQCKFYLASGNEIHGTVLSHLRDGFWCSKCDRKMVHADRTSDVLLHSPDWTHADILGTCDFTVLQSLFFSFLGDESLEEAQVACAEVLHRILMHAPSEIIKRDRSKWIKFVEDLLLHKNMDVREAFCAQISCFLDKSISDCLFSEEEQPTRSQEELLNKIKNALEATGDPHTIGTLLACVTEVMLAVEPQSQLFLLSLIVLVDHLDNPHMSVRVSAARLIRRPCYFHLGGGFELVISKSSPVRNTLFDYLAPRLATRPKMVEEFAVTVVGIKLEELIQKMIPVILPKLVVSHDSDVQAISMLYELAKCLNTDMVQLIVTWLPKVLAYALQQTSREELVHALDFYHAQTGSDNREIFAAALPALLEELVCFTEDRDPDLICQRLERVPQMIREVAKILAGSEEIPGFLRNHFVGLLNSVDRKLLHAEDVFLQKQAIKRIELLIKLMGSQLGTYVPKLMVLLLHAVEKDSLCIEGLTVLHFFIKQLAKLSTSSAKHVIFQVFAALIPFLERDKDMPSIHLDKIVNVLEDLVFENKVILKQHISEFPLLPRIPALTKVNQVIQEARGSMTLKDQLLDAANGLNHENLNVRYMVACELSKLLTLRKEDMVALIGGEAELDMNVLSALITSLLRGCAEESRNSVGQRLKMVCADCISLIGAVDPAKIKGVSCQRFKIQCSDDDLIFELIHKHLARAFRAAPDTVIQDSAALAIQELLKIAGCEASLDENAQALNEKEQVQVHVSGSKVSDSHGVDGRGQRLWGRFSNYVKEIIAPCLTSRFHLPSVPDSASSGPIFRPSMSFRRWIFLWIKKLTLHATGSRGSIFNACRGIVRHDIETAMYLLPYLVLDAVCHGTEEARCGITEEILSVLEAATSETKVAAVNGIGGGQSEVCIQAVFSLLDNLGQWADDVEQGVALSHSLQSSTSKQPTKSSRILNTSTESDQLFAQCKYVSQLLGAIPKVTLAKASLRCQAYARSLMYFESHVRAQSGSFNPAAKESGIFEDKDISFLMEIYSGLDEPDGLSGLACLRKSVSLQDQLLLNKKAGNWAEVLTLCEQALQMEPTSVQRHSDVLSCLLNMCHLQAMVTHVDGLISRFPQYEKTWCMQGTQAAWRLGRWELMDEFLNGADKEGLVCSCSENNASFDMDVAKILQAMMKKDQFAVSERIALSKQALIAPLAAAGMDSYMRAYPFIVKLHLLKELEDFHVLLAGESFLEKKFNHDDQIFSEVVGNWEKRLGVTQPSLWAREPLLAFRRLVFCATGQRSQVGSCWLQYGKLCRSAGHYETANRAILEAQSSSASKVHIERAKLLWSMKRPDGALAELQQSLLNMPVEVVGSAAISSINSLPLGPVNPAVLLADFQSPNETHDVAKTLLLYSRWIHHTGQKQMKDVMSLYSRVRELQPKWEKGYFYAAKYWDEVLVDARKRQEENIDASSRKISSASSIPNKLNPEKPWWGHLHDVLIYYAKGLHRGHKHLFQALPRLLTLWFDFGSLYQRSNGPSNKEMKEVNTRVTSVMRGCLIDLPTYQWLTVLPQLVSRICHHNEEIVSLVKHIIISVVHQYPQQSLWIMAAVSKSSVPSRREAAAEIIQGARRGSNQDNGCSVLISQFTGLIDHLIRLCFHPGQPKARTINISTEFSALKRMMPTGIIMPIQQSLTVSLPMCELSSTNSSKSGIFSTIDLPTISGIADEAEILSSLQRPKKMVLLGSDGIERPFLCKPKDDLRKDARMMEFNAMINRLLSKSPESRRRKLYIRTFAVIPLTEDCGMVEWVPHTRGLRHILQDIYITCGKFDRQKTNPQIKRIYDQCQGKGGDEMLKTKILPMFPPVFHKWFLNTFSEPAAWFRARVAYAHTTAVWSMVGHIVGLGDRHGENILFDSTTGDCVHVDFSCLFDKGLQLEKPELVPFRLTQNMIDGLGITGYEGIFLRVCEITLSVLRAHRETLMNVLETFIHDPLVEWTKTHKSSGVEVQNPHAQRAISNIEARLRGVVVGVAAAPSLPLAVEGQARRLIAEAVSHENLGKMYIWWMPWF